MIVHTSYKKFMKFLSSWKVILNLQKFMKHELCFVIMATLIMITYSLIWHLAPVHLLLWWYLHVYYNYSINHRGNVRRHISTEPSGSLSKYSEFLYSSQSNHTSLLNYNHTFVTTEDKIKSCYIMHSELHVSPNLANILNSNKILYKQSWLCSIIMINIVGKYYNIQ